MKALRLMVLVTGFVFTSLAFAEDANPKELQVTVTVPDSAWKLAIMEVHQTDKEVIIISKVSRKADVLGAQVITTLSQKINVVVPDLPVRYYVLGKTWGWENQDKGIEFIKDRKELDELLKGAKKIPLKE